MQKTRGAMGIKRKRGRILIKDVKKDSEESERSWCALHNFWLKASGGRRTTNSFMGLRRVM